MNKRKRFSSGNPFIFNICWLAVLSAITILILFEPCTDLYEDEFWSHIIEDIFYSALVLLVNEVVQLIRDKRELGILAGKYIRTELYELLPKDKRAEDLTPYERAGIIVGGKEVVEGSNYAKFLCGIGPE